MTIIENVKEAFGHGRRALKYELPVAKKEGAKFIKGKIKRIKYKKKKTKAILKDFGYI